MQRADSFAVGSGTRENKDRDDIDSFDEALESMVRKADTAQKESEPDQTKELEKHREEHAQLEAEHGEAQAHLLSDRADRKLERR